MPAISGTYSLSSLTTNGTLHALHNVQDGQANYDSALHPANALHANAMLQH